MRDITVLLSASGSPTMPGLVECFRANGERNIRIVGIDMSPDPTCRFMVDAFYEVPPATDPAYWSIVLEICQREEVDIYFPNISAEVDALIDHRATFEEVGTLISMSNPKSIKIANNKLSMYRMLKEAGMPVPEFIEVNTVDDFKYGCKELGFPERALCLKIVGGSGSRGVRVIDNKKSRYTLFAYEKPNSLVTSFEEMLSILESTERLDTMLLMPFLPGNEYTVDVLADHGSLLYQVGRENLVSLMSIAQESVLSKDEHAYEVSQKVVELLQFDGNVGFDFMRDAEGTAVLTDINPRITATVSVIAAGGVNLPYLRVKQLLGEPLPEREVAYGTRLKRRYHELFSDPKGNEILIEELSVRSKL